jgi:hypothetical protein
MKDKVIPNRVLEGDRFCRRLIVAVGEAVAKSMDESDWKKFAILHNLTDKTTARFRFLRSLSFDDPDHEGMVIEVVEHVFTENPEAFYDLFDRPKVQLRLKRDHPDLLEYWEGAETR